MDCALLVLECSRFELKGQGHHAESFDFLVKALKLRGQTAAAIPAMIKARNANRYDATPSSTKVLSPAPSGQPVLNAGHIFAPYVSKQKEIGAKFESDGGIGLTAALFETTKPLAFVRNGIYGNNGEQRNRGFELAVFGEPVRGLRVLGGLTPSRRAPKAA